MSGDITERGLPHYEEGYRQSVGRCEVRISVMAMSNGQTVTEKEVRKGRGY